MVMKGKSSRSSIKNNIMIAFILVILLGGIALTGISQRVLHNSLMNENIDTAKIVQVTREFTVISTGLTLAAIIVSLFVAMVLSRPIIRPLKKLTEGAAEVAQGNLDTKIEVESDDELGDLARDFNYMTMNLTLKIEELRETTAAKERIESELNVARRIQMSLLNKIFPPFPNRREFELFALIEPAREVGGDFYDFFLLDDDRLCFIIGDVSDKGVPASLFMVVTKTLLKVAASRDGATPDKILTEVNSELSHSNENAMFATIFCGILNTRTGEVLYANGGHNPPVLVRKDGGAEYTEQTGDIVVGVIEGAAFKMQRLQLEPGETLFCYTDGVTEANNLKGEMFSEEKLQGILAKTDVNGVRKMVASVMEEVVFFSADAVQSDDIAILALNYKGHA